MFIDGNAILHVVDNATRLSAVTFLDDHGMTYGQSVDGIWNALIKCWCTMHTGYPNRIRTDQGFVFTTPRWNSIKKSMGIQMRLSGIRAHSSLGIGERLHEPLRRIFNKVRMDYPHADHNVILEISVKAMNDTIG